MSLKYRLLLSLYSAALAAVLTGIAAFYFIVTPAYFDIEDGAASNELARVETAFMQTLTTLHARSRDWAERPSVKALADGDLTARPAPPGINALGDSGLDHVVVVDQQGGQHWLSSGEDVDQGAVGGLFADYQDRFCYPFWGVTTLSGIPHLFALEQVGDCGAVLFALALDQTTASELAGITGLPVELKPFSGDLERGNRVIRLDDGTVLGEFVIRDYQDKPLMLGRVTVGRDGYGHGARMLTLAGLSLLAVALLAVTLVHIYVRRTIFKRLAKLHQTVQRIAQGGNLDLRLRVPGNDELSALAEDFNRMVDSIRQSQRSLAEASERADSANRAKSLFLANMSHEIRTPMTAILGYTELLENPSLNEEERHRYLSVVQQNGDALMALISDVLDLSRIEAGQLKVERQRCQLPALMKEVIYSHRLKAEEKGVDLELEYTSPVPAHISTDPFRLRQILGNLIGNAIKFTDEGRVVVRLSWEDGLQSCLLIEVEDSGIGMNAADLDRVFEPFSQVDDSHTRRHGGSGLGLAIARQLARSMGGDISASSTPGHGSVFKVYIQVIAEDDAPRVMPQQALEVDVRSQQAPAIHVGGRVLLVEDNDVNRLLVHRILSRAGMEVVEAIDGLQALEKVAEDPGFDLVILDMQMPVMDGYAAARELRRTGFSKPILALTANVMSDDRRRCLTAGCDDFLGKPVRASRLLAACSRLISLGRTSGRVPVPDASDRE
ncbi:ATP-binding protein [Alcanivorax sp. 1008]|uniref:ATP-binding protein n=1 Tax=Alcanivorax sp. 1008 TaxID=2816853 RepID=UPI001D5D7FD4|nr:ATP-binding protein [Alcanivorax sp. 1008]MCC1495511.1 response regulator [Alcanivorax sp. 1008]